ncbi:MAG: hypothetical protein KatS3mg010_0630 [Acidimicrobiia bacterium]|nr:MAG: hypothetical protein KatS3mg010_0630 [Acidimicrobiia bacterium]
MNVNSRTDERGVALITVVIATTVLALLATAIVAYAEGSQNLSRRDQDWNAALAAAEAGIDDYLLRLNENANYWQYSAANPPPDGNLAFGQFVPVAGGGTEAEFRYDVDTSSLSSDGRLRITATGRVRDTTRTVSASLRRRSFIDYLYFTDYETRDPALYTGTPFSAVGRAARGARTTTTDGFGVAPRRERPQRLRRATRTPGARTAPTSTSSRPTTSTGRSTATTRSSCAAAPNFNGDTSTSWSGSSPGCATG